MSLIIQETQDGSHTLFSEQFNEIYHSRRGAWRESQHVFIEAGLKYILAKRLKINILEIGFGTALNAILSLKEVWNTDSEINYVGIEPLPVPLQIIQELNYTNLLNDNQLADYFHQIHQVEWNKIVNILPNFHLHKFLGNLEEFDKKEKTSPNPSCEGGELEEFDLVYFDAFAPSKQPEMWQVPVFQQIKSFMKPQGILVTYCAKGQLKRNLKSAGFVVESLPGPPGKREMIRAKIIN